MDAKNIEAVQNVCDDLRKRVKLNRPMDTEQMLETLLVIADSLRQLMPADEPRKEPVPAQAPKEPQTEQRHL